MCALDVFDSLLTFLSRTHLHKTPQSLAFVVNYHTDPISIVKKSADNHNHRRFCFSGKDRLKQKKYVDEGLFINSSFRFSNVGQDEHVDVCASFHQQIRRRRWRCLRLLTERRERRSRVYRPYKSHREESENERMSREWS